ncbi:MAG: 30S ribosomal protein S1 [Candidatus Eisenbacteria bacterium]|nr:30S ribosomal protein S1 [Candidatus Eisenbacteria bacterium]
MIEERTQWGTDPEEKENQPSFAEKKTPGGARRAKPSGKPFSGDRPDEGEPHDEEKTNEMVNLYEHSLRNIQEGEIVRGRVLHIDDKEIVVDVGFKSEGAIPVTEFPDPSSIKIGDEMDVYLEKTENQDGVVVLSKQKADFAKVWDRVKEAADSGEVVEGKLLRKIKGGIVVDFFGVEAFLPGSQIGLRQIQNIDALLNQRMKFKIIKLNKRRRNIVVSRRAVLEEERAKQKTGILKELAKDQVRQGVVKNITDFGAFVDLGGIDGLLHITDMSWGRISHPSEVVAVGDKITVKVLSFDPEKERISLGLKQLAPYPWEEVDRKYPVGSKIRGKVVSVTDYGAFVELEKGIEGLIHVSEMSWTRHVKHPSKIVAVGDMIEAVVLKIDKENEKISLGLKQTEPDPWKVIDETYRPGTKLVGRVRNLTNFGAFVELEEGIDGLLHVSDMSWTRRVSHPTEIVKKGDKVEVIVLSVDKDSRRISLGLRQLTEDPWQSLVERFPADTEVRGKVTRFLEKGLIVDLGGDIEGFVPISQLGLEPIKRSSDNFALGEEIPLKVTKVDPDARRIVLSVKGYFLAREKAEWEAFRDRAPKAKKEEVPEAAAEVGAEAAAVAETPEAAEAREDKPAAEGPEKELESGGETS